MTKTDRIPDWAVFVGGVVVFFALGMAVAAVMTA